MGVEEVQKVLKERWWELKSSHPVRRSTEMGMYRVRNGMEEHWERRNWLRNEIEEVQSRLRSSNENWGVPILLQLRHRWWGAGVWSGRWCVIDCVVASRVKLITGDGPTVPWYSSWENITVAFFPLGYSESAQWIAAAATAKVWGTRGWKYCDVDGWRPKLLAVKKNWWSMRSRTSILVNHDFLSSTTLER